MHIIQGKLVHQDKKNKRFRYIALPWCGVVADETSAETAVLNSEKAIGLAAALYVAGRFRVFSMKLKTNIF